MDSQRKCEGKETNLHRNFHGDRVNPAVAWTGPHPRLPRGLGLYLQTLSEFRVSLPFHPRVSGLPGWQYACDIRIQTKNWTPQKRRHTSSTISSPVRWRGGVSAGQCFPVRVASPVLAHSRPSFAGQEQLRVIQRRLPGPAFSRVEICAALP